MANTIPSEFTPFVTGAMDVGRYIQKGGETSAPYLKGVADLAANHNYLLGKISRQIIAQADTATIAWTTGTINWAQYKIRMPKLVDRSLIRVGVTATCSAGTYQVRGTTAAGTTAWTTAASSGTQFFDVTFDPALADVFGFDDLLLDFQMSTAGDFLPTAVIAFWAPLSGTGSTLEAAGAPWQTTCVYQDTDQYAVDAPLSVVQVQELLSGLNHMYSAYKRCVANWSAWFDWANKNTYDGGIKAAYDAGFTRTRTVRQFKFAPRYLPTGLNRLNCFVTARTDNYTGTAGRISLSNIDSAEPATVTIPSASATEEYLNPPSAPGYLALGGRGGGGAGEDLYILRFSIWD